MTSRVFEVCLPLGFDLNKFRGKTIRNSRNLDFVVKQLNLKELNLSFSLQTVYFC